MLMESSGVFSARRASYTAARNLLISTLQAATITTEKKVLPGEEKAITARLITLLSIALIHEAFTSSQLIMYQAQKGACVYYPREISKRKISAGPKIMSYK